MLDGPTAVSEGHSPAPPKDCPATISRELRWALAAWRARVLQGHSTEDNVRGSGARANARAGSRRGVRPRTGNLNRGRDGLGAWAAAVAGSGGGTRGGRLVAAVRLDSGVEGRYLEGMEEWLKARVDELVANGLMRDPADSELHSTSGPGGGGWVDACSNDYLGLGARAVSRETMDSGREARAGAGASRLVQGTFPEHLALEAELATWLEVEATLVTSSAFAANVGLVPALVGPGALLVSDALNHASIVDGCRLARGRVVVTPHLELAPVEAALRSHTGGEPAWVMTEGLFSMDGDSPDLVELRKLCDRFGAGLIVDEAHSLGVFGPGGQGACAALGVRADVITAGLGKAVGSQGGVIGGSKLLRTWLWNRARSFVFSTGMSPALCRLTLHQVRKARLADAQRARLLQQAAKLRDALRARGLDVPPASRGPIVPVVLGSNDRAMAAMAALRNQGILAQAIRPPTVPVGAARLRLTAHADWPEDAVDRIAAAVEAACAS
ncbi:MAG: 8-amino-7-oxononanoate synthase [Myxococcales bacterium]|nr:MAG: 8-amino-7-oxononanoate synthase [Myxococcales bacterium]